MLLKNELRTLHRHEYFSISECVEVCGDLLTTLQEELQCDPMDEHLHEEERVVFVKLHRLKLCEESHFHQKSKEAWVRLGDNNTRSFHNSIKVRRTINTISSLVLQDGTTITDIGDIGFIRVLIIGMGACAS